jgi:putative transcriptional regulator
VTGAILVIPGRVQNPEGAAAARAVCRGGTGLSMRRHPSPPMLAEFATGELSRAPGLTVSAHLEACDHCAAQVRALEEEQGRLLDSSVSTALAPGALARIAGAPPLRARQRSRGRLADVQISRATALAGLGARRWLAPGLWAAPAIAPSADRGHTFLLRAPAGMTMPSHKHRGRELIAVLMGAFDDGDQTYRAGDFADTGASLDHALKV